MNKKTNILRWCILLGITASAQTTNVGDLTISPNTEFSVVNDFDNDATGTVMNDGELFAYAHFNNDGLFSFSPGSTTSLANFLGTSVQQLRGTQLSEFYNIYFNNSAAPQPFELYSEISVANDANFDTGVVQNDGFGGTFIFEQFGDHSNTSDNSHVDGVVQKNGDVAFTYPIGDSGYYRNAAITAPDNTTDVYSSKYFLANSDTAATPHSLAAGVIDFIDNTEYWTVSRDQGTSEVLLTLSWDTTTPSAITVNPTSAIHIVRWDATLGFWVDEGGVVDAVNQTVTTVAEVSGYGIFTLARIKEDIILPGDIVIYNAVTPNNDGDNDFFFIDGIEKYPNNSVEIYNRWGVKVYETKGYNNADKSFKAFSEGRITVQKNDQLPTGTYFYVLKYEYADGGNSRTVKKAGYLYINGDAN